LGGNDSPRNYFLLLRLLFRTITNGKFEQCYKEIAALLPTILNGLFRIHGATDDTAIRGSIEELCLTIPARLSSLLPHLSLLMRLIIPALQSQNGDLTTLGLRTLEFWVDNLHPDFLYPVLSQNSSILSNLMLSLSKHLQPAPYPYGLIAVRLLGKLGGKNRRFLREPMNLQLSDENTWNFASLNLQCRWEGVPAKTGTHGHLDVFTIPLDRSVVAAVDVMRRVAEAPTLMAKQRPREDLSNGHENCASAFRLIYKDDFVEKSERMRVLECPTTCKSVSATKAELVDLTANSIIVMKKTKHQQCKAAFSLFRTIIASLMESSTVDYNSPLCCEVSSSPRRKLDIVTEQKSTDDIDKPEKADANSRPMRDQALASNVLNQIVEGLMIATLTDFANEALVLLKGLSSHLLLIITSHSDHIKRVDASGNIVDGHEPFNGTMPDTSMSNGKLQPLGPLGTFRLTGPLENGIDPFIFNEALAHNACSKHVKIQNRSIEIIRHLAATVLNLEREALSGAPRPTSLLTVGNAYFENLLSALCQVCFSKSWNHRCGPYRAIMALCESLGVNWSKSYVIEIFHCGMFCLKDSPREISCSSSKSLSFLLRIYSFFYASTKNSNEFVLYDALQISETPKQVSERSNFSSRDGFSSFHPIITQMLLSELNSPKFCVRFAARLFLKHQQDINADSKFHDNLAAFSTFLKKLLFSRALRLLPLPEQVGLVDALAFLVQTEPQLFPLSDQHLLALLSELLKMTAIADKEMPDKSGDGTFIDKDGRVSGSADLNNKTQKSTTQVHASALFLSKSYKLGPENTGGVMVTVPGEFPFGVQLRISAVLLFKAVVSRHTAEFFDAPTSNPIGNIRPHVISFFFRSLVSRPPEAVTASYSALHSCFFSGTSEPDATIAGQKPPSMIHRLPKELLQTCIRPVLLKLRDHTKLTVPLLRGLARLLALLASWFNNTLGQKLLDHLKKWENAKEIIALGIWSAGEEPLVAASIISLFELLPLHEGQFEQLVETVIKLDHILPQYKMFSGSLSPFRGPLTRLFNKYPQHAASFFLHNQRLKSPYSELFHEVIKNEKATIFRSFLTSAEFTKTILSTCFERPLAIIRIEKAESNTINQSNVKTTAEILSRHGVCATPASNSKDVLHRDVEGKQKKLQLMHQTENKPKDTLQAAPTAGTTSGAIRSFSPEQQVSIDATKRQCTPMQQESNKSKVEANEAAKTYKNMSDSLCKNMDKNALELQYQGFKLIGIFIKMDEHYFEDPHHACVARTAVELWRSKGRKVRFLYEELLTPTFRLESKFLARILIEFLSRNPSDVDILFELLRIFLTQGSCIDFSFVKNFLQNMVSNVLSVENKRKVQHYFFSLLNTDQTAQPTKILSFQLLMLPMLQADMKRNMPSFYEGQPPINGSFYTEMDEFDQIWLRSPSKQNNDTSSSVFDRHFIQKFIADAISKSSLYGERLHIELLKFVKIFIEFNWEGLLDHRKELIKFTWGMLKSETTKMWAYICMARFISAYETPCTIILQVYVALLKSHQPEVREHVNEAIDILVPCLPKRLSKHDFERAMKCTKTIMYEEGHDLKQLTHLLNIIVRHPKIFYYARSHFIPHIANSLNQVGAPTAPLKSKLLSLFLVDLILFWEIHRKSDKPTCKSSLICLAEKKRSHVEIFQERSILITEPPDKKQKNEFGSTTYVAPVINIFELTDTMVDILMNFLVRMALSTAEAKEQSTDNDTIGQIAILLFDRAIANCGKNATIRAAHFEKLINGDISVSVPSLDKRKDKNPKSKGMNKNIKGKSTGNKLGATKSSTTTKPTSSTKQKGDARIISESTLLSCLDLLIIMLKQDKEVETSNLFIKDNLSKMKGFFSPCFTHASKTQGGKFRRRLKRFLTMLFSKDFAQVQQKHAKFVHFIMGLMAETLDAAAASDAGNNSTPMECFGNNHVSHASSTPKTIKEKSTKIQKSLSSEFDAKHRGRRCLAHFVVEVIEQVYEEGNTNIIENFISSLLGLALHLTKVHIQSLPLANENPDSSDHKSGKTTSLLATPTIGIMEEACGMEMKKPSILTYKNTKEVKEVLLSGSQERCLIALIRILGNSNLTHSFVPNRKLFLQTLSNLIDFSQSIPVLMTAIGLLGKWMMADGGGPLTLKERSSFIWKMSAFDARSISDEASQPLVAIILSLIFSLHDRGNNNNDIREDSGNMNAACKNIHQGCSPISVADTKATSKEGVSNEADILLNRSMATGLLCSDHRLRSIYYTSLFDGGINVVKDDDTVDIVEIHDRSSVDILWQLLHWDFEHLGSRFWTVAFVDLMMATCRTSGGMKLDVCNSTSSKSSNFYWLKNPRRKKDEAENSCSSMSTYINLSILDDSYVSFLEMIHRETASSNFGQGRCLASIRQLVHGDIDLCQDLFQHLVLTAWTKLPNDSARLMFIPPLETLLARPFHAQFLPTTRYVTTKLHARLPKGLNMIQSWLKTIIQLRPLPLLDPDLLVSLAINYNAWHEVIGILECQHLAMNKIPGNEEIKTRYMYALRYCYDELSESDLSLSLVMGSCNLPESKRAITLDMYNKVNDALSAYSELVEKVESKQQSFGSAETIPSTLEVSLWETRWIELNKLCCQWQVLNAYGDATGDPILRFESAWKSRDWDTVKSLFASPSIVAASESGFHQNIKMGEIFVAIADGKLNEVEHLHAQAAQLCLTKWQSIPSIYTGCCSHITLFHSFQRLVELSESGQIMIETSNSNNIPDLKNLLSAWRERTPNDYDLLSTWEDIFLWRSHMFSAITTNFQNICDAGALATLHDRPWTAIRMAKTARKQGMKEVALLSLNKLTDCAMDVSDAFAKLREQILIYRDSDNQNELRGGLNLVNTTNLSFFDAAQKSELFRLKGTFLNSLRGRRKANQAYCQSVQICPTFSKAWLSWGALCSTLAEIEIKTNSFSEAQKSSSAGKKPAQYLAQAMGCYLQAIQCGSREWDRINLPKCLWMLSWDGNNPGLLCQTLEARGADLPAFVWLPWVPQLLTSLGRIEARAVKSILKGLVMQYPQAIYYSLRAFYLERRDAERAHRGKPSSAHAQPTTAVMHAEELMSILRKSHPLLWSSLETVLEELIVRFRPSLEEELLTTMKALLQRATAQLDYFQSSHKGVVGTKAESTAVLSSFSKTLSRVSDKFFQSTTVSSADGGILNDNRAKKAKEFIRRYKNPFEKDFLKIVPKPNEVDSDGTSQPCLALSLIIERLNKWKQLLEAQISFILSSLPMQQVSPILSSISNEIPDLWSGACDTKQMSRSNELSPSSSSSSSAAAALAAFTVASSAVASAAFSEGVGGHFGGGTAALEIPGQYPPYISSHQDSKPAPELHVKLVRFDSNVKVVRRNDGQQLVRRVGMVGSDGIVRVFLLQFAIPYMSRTDERTAQLHYILDKLLRKGVLACRRNLNVQPNPVIPIAQRLRMTADDPSTYSLDDIFRLDRHVRGLDADEPINYHKDEMRKIGRKFNKKTTNSVPPGTNSDIGDEQATKLEVYNKICETMVAPDILRKQVQAALIGPEAFFVFRKALSNQLAANSLLCYAFSVTDRSPSKFAMNIRCARIAATDFRFAYNSAGLLETNAIPFRMTRNIETMLGSMVLNGGSFIPAMSSVAEAVSKWSEEVNPALHIILRDDIIHWYASKSAPKSDIKNQELERQLNDRILKNVSMVQSRIKECAPSNENNDSKMTFVDAKLRQLLQQASSSNVLCMASPSFQAWL